MSAKWQRLSSYTPVTRLLNQNVNKPLDLAIHANIQKNKNLSKCMKMTHPLILNLNLTITSDYDAHLSEGLKAPVLKRLRMERDAGSFASLE